MGMSPGAGGRGSTHHTRRAGPGTKRDGRSPVPPGPNRSNSYSCPGNWNSGPAEPVPPRRSFRRLSFRGLAASCRRGLGVGPPPIASSEISSGTVGSSTFRMDRPILRSFGVDAQDLDLDLVADLDHVLRALDLVVGQLGDVQQPFQARLQLDEHAEVGELGDLAP